MRPALRPGDGIVAIRSQRVRRGEVRVFEHPDRPGFWLVKRVGDIHRDGFEATSDNGALEGVRDSRHFGPVPVAGSFRMVLRVPGPRGR